MEKYVMFVNKDIVEIQSTKYIEDGMIIRIIGKDIMLYEIPMFGGEESEIGKFNSVIEAINYSKTLS